MTTRIHLRVSGPAEKLLKEMGEQLDVQPKEIILDALGVYDWAVKKLGEGNRIGSYDKNDKFTAITTPTLARVDKGTRVEEAVTVEHKGFNYR